MQRDAAQETRNRACGGGKHAAMHCVPRGRSSMILGLEQYRRKYGEVEERQPVVSKLMRDHEWISFFYRRRVRWLVSGLIWAVWCWFVGRGKHCWLVE